MNIKELKERFERRLLDEKEIEFLFSKVEEMQKALEWYADPKNNNWKVDSFGEVIQSNVMVDDGERARQALKGESQ